MSEKIERRGRPRKKNAKDITLKFRVDEELLGDFNDMLYRRNVDNLSEGLRKAMKLYISSYKDWN